MKNKTIIIVIALILIIAGYLGYSRLAGKTSTNPSVTVTNGENKNGNGITGTIKGLLEQGLTQKCTITYPDNAGTGTIYFSGKKFNGEFAMTTGDQKVTGHSISDGTYVYIWSDNATSGVKMKLDNAISNAPTGTEQAGSDLNEEVKFTCSGWTLDQAKFTPPANIQFSDLSNLLPKATTTPEQNPTTTEEEKAGNSICDKITDPAAKAACLDAINIAGE